MTNPVLDSKLAGLLTEKLDHEDERAKERMAGGMLADFGEYRFAGGYRKALADAKQLLNEALKEILEE